MSNIVRTGKNNPNWRGGKPKCICGKDLHYTITICRKCSNKQRWGDKRANKRTGEGYVLVYVPDHPYARTKKGQVKGFYQEHRLVMEKSIGRMLKRTEVIHHINGIKYDNRIENLQLIEDNAKHICLEQKGRAKSESFKELMRKRMTGKKYWLGKKHKKETKSKMSEARKAYWERRKDAFN